ncbi:hypothetical protein K432DRAFT_304574 [Lepidopterella palustris CBS 459.81]|uniref:Uncharacterized protein n=1 Tax=Lepidopterella palustris CBS 459.81 TaxID=1314670 RepID=A0A8E2E4Z5_9PEZI|nr:hypothetical protein K432DRAFT_304574 [Lepidopterella palustris CBS 459.81]
MPHVDGQLLDPLEENLLDDLVPTRQASESDQRTRDRPTCSCLRRLADHLCHLHTVEQKHEPINLCTTLAEADGTRKCAEIVLDCHCCQGDLKVAMLITTVLQTLLDWLSVSQRRSMQVDQTPKVLFGTWTIPKSDAMSVGKLLTYRVLAKSQIVVNNLRLRIDKITFKASKSGMSCKFIDTKYLQQALHRLAESLRELVQHVRN